MRSDFALILFLALAAPASGLAQGWTPPAAEDPAPESSEGGDGNGALFERGLESFMQNMLKEAEPHLERLGRDLGDTMLSLRPVFQDLGKLMDDVQNYQAPERLENGDILIRRRADAPPPPPVGDALREMLRPAPGDDPRLNPERDPGPDAPPRDILPELPPGPQIEL
ncbi:hypothetical protein SAMN04487972_12623 [Paracoccus halophilus]|uniref:AAA+ family ATPase n=1 Tax=Paracoccus halophilus TaxID=376733 RepID=A0A1I0U7P4_9RHOB|nr:hypothetical protein [Paracoccus halophilus]SFA60044.1 hypothetical protein SAMN04487972_12623 [Paracoccus halophilus]